MGLSGKIVYSVLVGVFICTSTHIQLTHASDFDFHADVSYSEANPDFSDFSNGEGVTWYGRVTYAQSGFVFVRRSNANFQPSGKVSGAEVEYWFESGLGYRMPIYENWAVEGNISYQEIEQNGDTESGRGYQLGVRYQPIKVMSFGLDVGKIDVKIEDWTLAFEADYQIMEHLFIVTRLRDYADWDFTYYEVGVGLNY